MAMKRLGGIILFAGAFTLFAVLVIIGIYGERLLPTPIAESSTSTITTGNGPTAATITQTMQGEPSVTRTNTVTPTTTQEGDVYLPPPGEYIGYFPSGYGARDIQLVSDEK